MPTFSTPCTGQFSAVGVGRERSTGGVGVRNGIVTSAGVTFGIIGGHVIITVRNNSGGRTGGVPNGADLGTRSSVALRTGSATISHVTGTIGVAHILLTVVNLDTALGEIRWGIGTGDHNRSGGSIVSDIEPVHIVTNSAVLNGLCCRDLG